MLLIQRRLGRLTGSSPLFDGGQFNGLSQFNGPAPLTYRKLATLFNGHKLAEEIKNEVRQVRRLKKMSIK